MIRSPFSAIVDSLLTMARGNEIRVFAWYDNEWGYSCRLVDLIATVLEPERATMAREVALAE